ncbi:carboxypeptidase M32 [Rhodobacteraceae bacterium RKSG542]|uniref:carboxypeptidase M32 n=1 Tax=Pseudovibrio flavus TaxID=2529854 RepID=UPI0012BBE016|nr:carboxypeptidase M32 [Pseudovibrio flavus]MTI18122.1 carboxypeptidase M32 [Pseudovibrio flavus]
MNENFKGLVGRLNDVLSTVNLLSWDARVMMPSGGAETRGHQIATLMGIARDMVLDPAMVEAAQAVFETAQSETDRRAASAVLEASSYHSKIPASLLRRKAEASVIAGNAWADARATADFKLFQPHLEDIVSLARETAQCLGYEDHPYTPLVQVYEGGATATGLSQFFDELRSGIRPILETALSRPAPRKDFLYRDFNIEKQREFCAKIAEELGYDTARGRLDTTVHPFEISFTRNDVRITSRWDPNYLPMAIFGTIHETGHALYEQGVKDEYTRSAHTTDMIGLYAVGGNSFGMHESQSRLLENHIGRSPTFWAKHYGTLRDTFPDQLGDVSVEEFVAAVNRVDPGLIRVEADEMTYDLHIMLRVRLEMSLMDGSLSVADVPAAWNEAMENDLGLCVPNDGLGCLQDVHWSHGYIGSFPTYTIGNSTAAQIMAHIKATDQNAHAKMMSGDAEQIQSKLGEMVWQHGRAVSRAEILEGIGCNAYDPTAYLNYLSGKFN